MKINLFLALFVFANGMKSGDKMFETISRDTEELTRRFGTCCDNFENSVNALGSSLQHLAETKKTLQSTQAEYAKNKKEATKALAPFAGCAVAICVLLYFLYKHIQKRRKNVIKQNKVLD
jgi:hypothetical protein